MKKRVCLKSHPVVHMHNVSCSIFNDAFAGQWVVGGLVVVVGPQQYSDWGDSDDDGTSVEGTTRGTRRGLTVWVSLVSLSLSFHHVMFAGGLEPFAWHCTSYDRPALNGCLLLSTCTSSGFTANTHTQTVRDYYLRTLTTLIITMTIITVMMMMMIIICCGGGWRRRLHATINQTHIGPKRPSPQKNLISLYEMRKTFKDDVTLFRHCWGSTLEEKSNSRNRCTLFVLSSIFK